ncbi:MAG: triphosphoribosyl-dephospho-CoA synthase [Saccharolobus sp.]|uniref:triphosphoribosyl-dephospho-CoA synthase n=1 Tax=Saccharolobus sp. TaxID=2100761 RepID=UPI0028CE34D6|nr:triphosphoribosyl-dephospho-CoA synthase [Saccharolobus sp.]MDT7861288.1 triphosphoribosyl-dephospho-CoA synthase [Saccharolobus sp.]
MIEKLEVISNLCNNIAFLLSQASIMESYIFKPGNASRFQDLNNVKYIDIVKSIILSTNYYKELCIRNYLKIRRIYDTILNIIDQARKLGFEYQLFGTYLLLAPIAYVALTVSNIFDLKKTIGNTIKSLNNEEAKWFLDALKRLNLSYLGKLSFMDYRDINNIDFITLMKFSSNYDIVALNIVNEYLITFEAYNIIKENLCDNFEKNVQRAFIKILSKYPDTLISKKYGVYISLKVSKIARSISECPSEQELNMFNKFLLQNNLNPGSTADLIASSLAIYYLDEWYKKNGINWRTFLQHECDRSSE